MTIGKDLTCRSLASAMAAYGIELVKEKEGTLGASDCNVKTEPCAEKVGFIGEVTCITAGLKDIHAAYVGENEDGVILGLRGTLPPAWDTQSVLDWANDLMAAPVELEGFPGKVHSGIGNAMLSLWNAGVEKAVRERLEATGKPLIVTGHSKGGALSFLAAVLLDEAGMKPDHILSFEGAAIGDPVFAADFKKRFPDQCLRFEYQDDLVPHLPPSKVTLNLMTLIPVVGPWLKEHVGIDDWDYVSVGHLRFIDWKNEIQAFDGDETWKLYIQRMGSLPVAFFKTGPNGLPRPIDDHKAGPCHFMKVLCGSECEGTPVVDCSKFE